MDQLKVLITGASSGVGECLARTIARSYKDATLILTARNKEKLLQMAEELPCDVYVIPFDLQNVIECKQIFEICKEKNLKLNALIHCAGIDETCPIKASKVERMQKIMNINCFSFVELAKNFYRKINSEEGSKIIAISSIASERCEAGMMAYSASKAALNAVIQTMAKEFSSREFCVNALLPAGIDTPMARRKNDLLQSMEKTVELMPVQVVVDEIMKLLVSSEKTINGELIPVLEQSI